MQIWRAYDGDLPPECATLPLISPSGRVARNCSCSPYLTCTNSHGGCLGYSWRSFAFRAELCMRDGSLCPCPIVPYLNTQARIRRGKWSSPTLVTPAVRIFRWRAAYGGRSTSMALPGIIRVITGIASRSNGAPYDQVVLESIYGLTAPVTD